jgi:methyl-accepting chemotaxis protein
MNLDKMTVKARLFAGFGVLVLAVLIVSAMALKDLGDSNENFSGYVRGIDARAQMAESIRTAVDRRAIAARNLVLVTRPEDIAMEKAEAFQAEQDVEMRLGKLNEMIAMPGVSDNVRAMVAEINRIETEYRPVALGIVNLALDGKRDEATVKINVECRPLLSALIKATDAYLTFTQDRSSQIIDESEQRYAFERTLLIAICLVAIGLAVLAGYLITRSLTRALGAEPAVLSEVTQRVAAGDLNPVEGAQQAPEGSVLAAMGKMQQSLVNLIGQVRSAADSIATGSSQIASGNLDLSSRTEQQASSLQETAASMEQLTSTVKQNAESAQQASNRALNAAEVAQKGNAVVSQVVETMDDISQSSAKIADITGIIEGIAFQTNILALNAAVEAARAGEQGRGFAVVASEVRSLAQRSSSAAKEIKDLIATSVQKIKAGSEFAGEAGRTMSEVNQAIGKVTEIVKEIAAATVEQSHGIQQVNQSITQMDTVTQQNAALVEEASAASQSLENQGRELTQAVAFFRLDRAQANRSGSAAERASDRIPDRAAPLSMLRRPQLGKTVRNPIKRASAPLSLASAAVGGGSDGADWETF